MASSHNRSVGCRFGVAKKKDPRESSRSRDDRVPIHPFRPVIGRHDCSLGVAWKSVSPFAPRMDGLSRSEGRLFGQLISERLLGSAWPPGLGWPVRETVQPVASGRTREAFHGGDACRAGLGPEGPFRDRGTADPGARAGGVRIKVQACGICHSDSLTKEGLLPGHPVPAGPRPRGGRRDRCGRPRRRRMGAGPAGRRRLERRLLRVLRPLPPRRVLRLRARPGHRHHAMTAATASTWSPPPARSR